MFEWDEPKRRKNLEKHGVDLVVAIYLFDGRAVITLASRYEAEARFITTGRIEDKFYSVVWTWRDQNRRLISLRRARDDEERKYRQIYG